MNSRVTAFRMGWAPITSALFFLLPRRKHLIGLSHIHVIYGDSWTVKKAERQRIDAFEVWCWRRLESPFDCKEIQPAHSEDQPRDFFGRNDVKAEAPVLWPPHAKS